MTVATLLNAVTAPVIGAEQAMPSMTMARFLVTVNNPTFFAAVTLEATTDGQNYNPIRSVQITPGATSQATVAHFAGAWVGWRAVLESLRPAIGAQVTATATY